MATLERHALRIGLAGCLLLLAALYLGGPLGFALGVGGAGLLGLAAYSPDHGLLLFGPFAVRELQLVARKPTVFVARVLILTVVLVVFLVNHSANVRGGQPLGPDAATAFAEELFGVLAGISAIVCACYAAWVLPTVISEERDAKRLEHLLVTDLRSREILAGKIAGRLVVLLGYAILPVPVMAILTLLGGVEPRFVLTVGVLFVAGLLGVSGVAIACSSVARKSATAIVSSLVVVALHQSVTYQIGSESGWFRSADRGPVLTAVAMGSVAFTCEEITRATHANALDTEVPRILRHFVAGQLLVLLLGWLFGMRFLRNDGRRDGGTFARRAAAWLKTPPARAPVGPDPVLWQELTSGSFFVERWARRPLAGHLWPVWVVAFVWSLGHFALQRFRNGYVQEGQVQVAISAAVGFFATCGPVAWSASRCVVRERQLDTLDALLVTTLEPDEIVWQKWLGAVLSVRYAYGCFVLFWLAAGLTGQISAVAFVSLVATSAAALTAAAALGVLASVYSSTAIRAFGKVFFGYAAWNGGLLLCGFCCAAAGAFGGGRVVAVIVGAIAPPTAQVVSAFLGETDSGRDSVTFYLMALLHLVVLAIISFVALHAARDEFHRQTRPTKRQGEHDRGR